MTEFLQATPVIDCGHPAVVAKAAELAGNATDDEQVARRCFLWVRDHVRHSNDYNLPAVTCAASEVLRQGSGFCYAKSHLLVALLRARGIPAALCYQRLSVDGTSAPYCLHGLVAVLLKKYGWYRVDPRGNKPGVQAEFCPPVERLAFNPVPPEEFDIPGLFAEPLPEVVATLERWPTAELVAANLPDNVGNVGGRASSRALFDERP